MTGQPLSAELPAATEWCGLACTCRGAYAGPERRAEPRDHLVSGAVSVRAAYAFGDWPPAPDGEATVIVGYVNPDGSGRGNWSEKP